MAFLMICEISESIVVCAYAYFTLLWYWIAMPCYIIVMIILVKYRKKEDLKPAFFKLLFSIGLVDMVMLTNFYIGNKMLYMFGWIWVHNVYKLLGNPSVKVTNFLNNFCFICEAYHVIAIGANRLTAMVLPFKHKTIWSSARVKWVIVCGWAFAAVIAGPILTPFINIELVEIANSSQVIDNWENQSQLTAYIMFSGICGLTVGVTSLFLYLITSHAAYKRYKKQKLSPTTNTNGREELIQGIKLVIAGFAVALPLLVQISSTVIWRMAAMFGLSWNDFFYVAFGLSNDMYGGLNPFVLIAFSKSVIRKYVKQLFSRNNTIAVVVAK